MNQMNGSGTGLSVPLLCWYYSVEELSDPALFSYGMEILPWENRREKVLRFRFDRDRQLCLGAGLLAAFALRQAGAEDLSLAYGEHEKPYLLNRKELCFNLSHSGSVAVCAVSSSPVGVDVEKPRTPTPALLRHCFTENELRWFACQPDPDRAFIRLWTRKESYLKLLGTGLSLALNSFSVCPGEPGPDNCFFSESETAGHLLCVCSGESRPAVFRKAKLF